MARSVPDCDICSIKQKSVPAEIRCLECEDSLCMNCKEHHALFKGTRNHDTVPINDYINIPDFILEVGQVCRKHNDRFLVYCHDHESLGCGTCVLEDHRTCKSVVKIEIIVNNIKSSSAFTEVEEVLSNMSKNIENLQSNRQDNLTSLREQKLKIAKDIGVLRAKINEHLNKIHAQIIEDLSKKEKREREKIEFALKSLYSKNSEIKQLQEDISAVKSHATDLQTFLLLGDIEKRSNKACKEILDMKESGEFNNTKLMHKVSPQMSDLASINFGAVVTMESPSTVKLITSKDKQAQLPVDVFPSYSIESVSVKLNRTIDTGCQRTRGCVVLPDGRSLFTCYDNDTITSFDKDGNHQYTKPLKPSSAFDIAYSEEDMNKIFISSGWYIRPYFVELNLVNGEIKYQETDSNDYGIVVKHNTLIYCAQNKGICERSLSDGSVRVIVSERLPKFCYVTEYRDQLYYTNNSEHSITCCRMDGTQIWKFTNDALKIPLGVSVDNYGNVHVVGEKSTNVMLISADGKRHREILSKNDGLVRPEVLYYQRSTNQLLVANRENKAYLFDVSFT